MNEYDIVVIGSGPGGYVAAVSAARSGARVALVEKEDIGGLCLNWGCIPSKILLKKGGIFSRMRQMKEMKENPIVSGDWTINFESLIAHSRERVATIRESLTGLIDSAKVAIVRGTASFENNDTLSVMLQDGKTTTLRAAYGIIIATGGRPRELKSVPIDKEYVITSREALDLSQLPETLAIIGGGVIGCEMASFFAALGTKVTILEFQSQLLPGTDPDISKALGRAFKRAKIDVRLGAAAERATIGNGRVILALKEGEPVEAQKVLVAIGIGANTEALQLEKIGVETQRGFITVDPKTYQTNIPGVYAIGDVISLRDFPLPHPGLAHVASAEGELAVETILEGRPSWAIDYENIPFGIFTDPEIGIVGLTEEQAKTRYPDHTDKIVTQRLNDQWMGIGLALEETLGIIKLVIDEAQYGKILGAHMIGPSATERIHTIMVARRAEESAHTMAHQPFAHPTFSEGIREALLALDGRAVHVPVLAQQKNKTRKEKT